MPGTQERADARKSERKYQVFISSTFGDLADQRRTVLEAVIDRGHMPIALERFPAADRTVPYVIQKAIETSQIYIVILGFRYGEMANNDVSFTHLEYRDAMDQEKVVVVPFLLSDAEVASERRKLQDRLDADKIQLSKLAGDSPEHNRMKREVERLELEVGHEKNLWDFRREVSGNRFCRRFSLIKGSQNEFDKSAVLLALLGAEEEAERRRIPGWIREPEESEFAEAVEAVAQNRFFVDVVRSMAQFATLAPRVRDHTDQKQIAAAWFAEKYLLRLQDSEAKLFFESGSTIAYAADAVCRGITNNALQKEILISTNNVLAYLIFWLVHGIRCSLFPWGLPEERYGAVFGCIDRYVPKEQRPAFPPRPLTGGDAKAIDELLSDYYSPAKWTENPKDHSPALLLGALSGLQLTLDEKAFYCLGPHVGSPRNKIFKRFMYATKHPVMYFLHASKIDCRVDPEHCHFILEQETQHSLQQGCDTGFPHGLDWATFCRERPVAFCVGCATSEADQTARRFQDLGFKVVSAGHKTASTALIARNEQFVEALERRIDLRL